MKHGIRHVSIATPCTADWQNMQTDAKGKFCNSCQKSVMDFSTLTNAEILTILSSSNNICGRFGDYQLAGLNRELEVNNHSTFSWKKFGIAAAFIGVFPFVKAIAQVKPDIEQHPKSIKKITGSIGPFLTSVNGKVIDQISKTPIEGAIIRVKGSNNVVFSDESGHFKISGLTENDTTIVCSYMGHNTQEIKIDPIRSFCTIGLTPVGLPAIDTNNITSLQWTIGAVSVSSIKIDDHSDETEWLLREIFR